MHAPFHYVVLKRLYDLPVIPSQFCFLNLVVCTYEMYTVCQNVHLFMVALLNRADHYIIALWFFFFLSFFPRLISDVADWMSAILPHMVWP